jgi:hypothetical protein
MSKLLQDIWILDDSGIVLFHRVFDEKLDTDLFGGLLSALNSFAEQLTAGGLSNFELAEKSFIILKKKRFLFIANSSPKHSQKKVKQELKVLMQRFFQFYPEDVLNNWNGDTSIFYKFDKKIENSLEDSIKKLEESFW